MRDRTGDRDARGHFTAGNKAATERTSRAAVRAMVPQAGRALYAALLRVLGTPTNPLVALQVAKLVRHELDAAELDLAARTAGLTTEAGGKLQERAAALSDRAERLAVTAHDLSLGPSAQRRAKAIPKTSKVDAMKARVAAKGTDHAD